MTIQQKLDLFTQKTMESVNRQCLEAAHEIQNAIKTAVSETKKKARKEMADRVRIESYQLERESNKKIHTASMAARRDLSALRKRLTNELLTDLEKNLRHFADTPAYKDFILEGLIAATTSTLTANANADMLKDFAIVQLMAKDIFYEELKIQIEVETAFTVEATDEDFIGGFRLISENGRKIADYTLLARLKDLKIV